MPHPWYLSGREVSSPEPRQASNSTGVAVASGTAAAGVASSAGSSSAGNSTAASGNNNGGKKGGKKGKVE